MMLLAGVAGIYLLGAGGLVVPLVLHPSGPLPADQLAFAALRLAGMVP